MLDVVSDSFAAFTCSSTLTSDVAGMFSPSQATNICYDRDDTTRHVDIDVDIITTMATPSFDDFSPVCTAIHCLKDRDRCD